MSFMILFLEIFASGFHTFSISRIFSHYFCFACITGPCSDIFWFSLVSPICFCFIFRCIVSLSCCLYSIFSFYRVRAFVVFFFLSFFCSFSGSCNFFICGSSLISLPAFVFRTLFRGMKIFLLTNFATILIRSFSSMILSIGIFFNYLFILSGFL